MNMDRSYYQVCQGHGTVLACCTYEDSDCPGHGMISYCDGTCESALAQWRHALEFGRVAELDRPVPTMASVTLGFRNTVTGGEFTARFEGPDAEAWALSFITKRRSTHNVYELIEQPFDGTAFPALLPVLYPQCHHNMDASLCMEPIGENHFGTREQEMAWEQW